MNGWIAGIIIAVGLMTIAVIAGLILSYVVTWVGGFIQGARDHKCVHCGRVSYVADSGWVIHVRSQRRRCEGMETVAQIHESHE